MRLVLGYVTMAAILAAASLPQASSFKILILAVFESKSMRNIFTPLAKGLVSHGHDVTLMGSSPVHSEEELGGVKVRVIDKSYELLQSFAINLYDIPKQGTSAYTNKIFNLASNLADFFLQHEASQELYDMPANTYDMVIVNALICDFSLPLVDRLARTKVLILTPEMLTWVADVQGIPYPYSFVPNTLSELPTKMNFWQRVANTWLSFESIFAWNTCLLPSLNSKVQRRFPGLPTIEEVHRRVSLFLVNSEPALTIVKPSVPYVIDVGAMHCRPPKPLEGELADVVNGVTDEGFIVFSLGSILDPDSLPPEVKTKLLNVLSRLKQKVIWKYNGELKNLPANVKTFKWLPQQDLIGHPKIRLLITHGGLLSLQEAVYHGVPVLGIPVFAEQPGNLARILERGIGKRLDLHDFTEDSMFESIQELLTNSSYSDAMKNYSKISRDRLHDPLDLAIYWIEYVIRHDGALHLRTAADHLYFFQYFLLDVIAFILVGLLLFTYLVVRLTIFVFNVFSKKDKRKSE